MHAGQSDQTGRVGAQVVAQFIGNLQRLLNSLGQYYESDESGPISAGRIPRTILSKTRLDVMASYPGSMGIVLEAHDADDMFGDSLMSKSLAGLFELLEAGTDFESLKTQMMQYKSRVASNYGNLLGVIESSDSSVNFIWHKPEDNPVKYLTINPIDAAVIVEHIGLTRSLTKEEIKIVKAT